jgi:formate hydrogenlyase subunit 3/multisubunit Na+/H+ antiporter MnhD subunit
LVKTSFFCFSNFFYLFFDQFIYDFCFGLVLLGIIDSSIRMWSSTDVKRLIAYTTIQEMNLILLLFLVEFNTNSSFFFLNNFLITHGLLSSLLFYLVDILQKKIFSRNIVVLSGFGLFSSKFSIFMWLSLLIFRSFPIFIKFIIEWQLLSVVFVNYGISGLSFLFWVFVFSVLGLSRLFFIILYGQPCVEVVYYYDFIKNDWAIGLLIVSIIWYINFLLCCLLL